MKIKKFLNIDIEPAPPEMELDVELRCREIMKSNDVDNIKRYCTHLVRHQLEQDVFMASMLGRLVELEANAVVNQIRNQNSRPKTYLKKFFRID
jgi:predicted molibdopterin-dependent oxidoreductase YjgC